MATIANNIKQLARYENENGVVPAEAEAVVAEYRTLVGVVCDSAERGRVTSQQMESAAFRKTMCV